jgi:signal transduction histidine kinase
VPDSRTEHSWFSSDLIEILPAAVYVCDASAAVVAWNRRATELWGRTPGRGDTDEKYCGAHKLFRPDGTYLPHAETPMEWVLRTGSTARDQEVVIERPDGSRVTVIVNIAPLFDRRGTLVGAVNCFQDLTAQKHAEIERSQLRDQLHQAQKMDALGRLTGGLAHDFNNLLTTIAGNLELLESRLTDPTALKMLARANDATMRGARLIAQILAFARRQTLDPRPVDLNEIIAKMTETLAHTLGGLVRVEAHCASGLWPASADPTQCELAIMNLVLNARDAMPCGGTINIATENVGAAPLGRLPGQLPGDYVRVAVTDTGHGMSEEVLARVFEPYFTTKEPGKGTGLGLSIMQGMVTQLGGHVAIDSAVGKGTSVSIFLPRAVPEAAVESARASPDARGSGRILIVEDDPDVLSFLVDALNTLGYDAVTVPDSASALSVVEQGEPIDAVLSDLEMPAMSGMELLARLREIRPGLKGMLVTDDADAVEQPQASLPLLRKPFHVAALAEQLRTLFQPEMR